MKLLKLPVLSCFFLFACSESELTPAEAAQQACEWIKLSKDSSVEGLEAVKDCNTKTTEMMNQYRDDPEWMKKWREELLRVMKECVSE